MKAKLILYILALLLSATNIRLHAQKSLGGTISGLNGIASADTQRKLKPKELHGAWNNIKQSVKERQTVEQIIQSCRQLICSTSFTDTLAYNARTLLSEIYASRMQNMNVDDALNGMYEQLVYFNSYSNAFPDNLQARQTRDKIEKRYFDLVKEDMSGSYPSGVYVSDAFSSWDEPLLLCQFGTESGGELLFSILPSCGISETANAYGGILNFKKNEFASKTLVEIDAADSCYLCLYNAGKLRQGKTDIAQGISQTAGNIRAGQAGQSSDFATNMMSGMLSGVFDSWAKSLAANKITTSAAAIKFEPGRRDSIKATVWFYKSVQKDNSAPEVTEIQRSFYLHKMYPHYNMMFKSLNGCGTYCRGAITPENFMQYKANFLFDKHYAAYSVLNADFIKNKAPRATSYENVAKTSPLACLLLNKVFSGVEQSGILPCPLNKFTWCSYNSAVNKQKFTDTILLGKKNKYKDLEDTVHLLEGYAKFNGTLYYLYLRQTVNGDIYYILETKDSTKVIHQKPKD